MVVIVRIDLDKISLSQVTELVRDKVLTISDASESKEFKKLSDYDRLLKVREWQARLEADRKRAA